jgi:heptosyltransferase-2
MTGGLIIIQTAFPGDVILTGGLVRSARAVWGDLPLAMVVRPDTAQIAEMMDPDLEVIPYDKGGADRGRVGLTRMARRLADGPWDAALVPHRSIRSALLARRAGLSTRIGYDVGPQSWVHTHRVPYRRGVHEVERHLDLLAALCDLQEEEPPLFRSPVLRPTAQGIGEAQRVFAELGSAADPPPFVALSPGSVWDTKRWPESYWKMLAGVMAEGGLEVVLIGGKEDEVRCARIATAVGVGVSTAGMLSWQGTAALLDRAYMLVSNDSAPVHLAGAVQCPVLTIFGPTVPGFGFSPLGEGSRSIGLRLGCRPCRLHGSRTCPEGHFRCMKDLTPGYVVDAVTDLIETLYGQDNESGPMRRRKDGVHAG